MDAAALSVTEFCARYGVGKTTFYEELSAGRIRARKLGKKTIVPVEEADNWLRNLPLARKPKSEPQAA